MEERKVIFLLACILCIESLGFVWDFIDGQENQNIVVPINLSTLYSGIDDLKELQSWLMFMKYAMVISKGFWTLKKKI